MKSSNLAIWPRKCLTHFKLKYLSVFLLLSLFSRKLQYRVIWVIFDSLWVALVKSTCELFLSRKFSSSFMTRNAITMTGQIVIRNDSARAFFAGYNYAQVLSFLIAVMPVTVSHLKSWNWCWLSFCSLKVIIKITFNQRKFPFFKGSSFIYFKY